MTDQPAEFNNIDLDKAARHVIKGILGYKIVKGEARDYITKELIEKGSGLSKDEQEDLELQIMAKVAHLFQDNMPFLWDDVN